MVSIASTSLQKVEALAESFNIALPIEQTQRWVAFQATIPGRTPWRCVAIKNDGRIVAVASLVDYETHGYHYLRAHHGPVWFETPSEELEREAILALARYVRHHDRRQIFMRVSINHDLDFSRPTLSTVPYDTTVIVDVRGGDEAILKRMKKRGRRDVRKALREAPITCADETVRARASFDEYYPVLTETAQRDGFTPPPQMELEHLLESLCPTHCRVFAGRLMDGTLCTWSICTMHEGQATRYYAASLTKTMPQHVTDRLLYFECCVLGRSGCLEYDLMAIGSDFAPKLMALNEFKTKFSKEKTHVPPDRDVPIRRVPYGMLTYMKNVMRVMDL